MSPEPYLLPVVFEYLESTHDGKRLRQKLISELSQRSVMEQQQVKSFAQNLLSVCDNLLSGCGDEKEKQEEAQDVIHDTDMARPGSNDPSSGRETSKCGRLEFDTLCSASSIHSTPSRRKKATSRSTLASLGGAVGNRPLQSHRRSREGLRTPEPTPSRAPPHTNPEIPCPPEEDLDGSFCDTLINQSMESFVRESCKSIERFEITDHSRETCKIVMASVRHRIKQRYDNDQNQDDEAAWSDGSQFVSRLESANATREKGSIWSALSAIDFVAWHKSQVQLLNDAKTAQEATQEVSARVIKWKLGERNEANNKEWERNRRRLNTDLTRGRKWFRITQKLGLGILFREAWGIGKSSDSELEKLANKLANDKEKMTVLGLLDRQMDTFAETGKTNLVTFCEQLETVGLASFVRSACPLSPKIQKNLYEQVQARIQGDRVLVKGTGFEFGVKSLKRLDGQTWLNDEIILACLHLSDKLPFARVGVSVPVYQTGYPNIVMPRPFQVASIKMREWHQLNGNDSPLIGIFPLNLWNTHFTLLEINERAGCIFHYDSQGIKHKDIERACKREFPDLNYMEVMCLRQTDGHSCGPSVIRQARRRMMGQLHITDMNDDFDSKQLRVEACKLLQAALDEGGLIGLTGGRKRPGAIGANRRSKRLQVGGLDLDNNRENYIVID